MNEVFFSLSTKLFVRGIYPLLLLALFSAMAPFAGNEQRITREEHQSQLRTWADREQTARAEIAACDSAIESLQAQISAIEAATAATWTAIYLELGADELAVKAFADELADLEENLAVLALLSPEQLDDVRPAIREMATSISEHQQSPLAALGEMNDRLTVLADGMDELAERIGPDETGEGQAWGAPGAGMPDPVTGDDIDVPEPKPDVKPKPPPVTAQTKVDSIRNAMPWAKAGLIVPTVMNKGETRTVYFVIDPDDMGPEKHTGDLANKVSARDSLIESRVQFSSTMKAELTGSAGLEIAVIGPSEQSVYTDRKTEWRWKVTAVAPGPQWLTMSLLAIVTLDGDRGVHRIQTFEADTIVQVSLGRQISGFVGNNWQWLLTTLVLPIGAWLVKRKRKKDA